MMRFIFTVCRANINGKKLLLKGLKSHKDVGTFVGIFKINNSFYQEYK